MFFAFHSALNSSVVYFANFLRVKSCPFLVVKTPIKGLNILNVNKIDKSIANVTVVKKIYRQIEKVKLVFELPIKSIKHLLLSVFIRYVPYHECSPISL